MVLIHPRSLNYLGEKIISVSLVLSMESKIREWEEIFTGVWFDNYNPASENQRLWLLSFWIHIFVLELNDELEWFIDYLCFGSYQTCYKSVKKKWCVLIFETSSQ